MRNVAPTHLLDRALHDFASVRATGVPPPDGDLAFDEDASLTRNACGTEAVASIALLAER
jgi:hypothetical protein